MKLPIDKIQAILKYIIKLPASTIVVIKGLAITAGSILNFSANIGKIEPITLAKKIVKTNVIEITKEIATDIANAMKEFGIL